MPVSIIFREDGAGIGAKVDAPQVDKSTPFQQCIHALMKHSPQEVHATVEHSGKSQSSKVEVTVLPSLMAENPLLADIAHSTQTPPPSKKKQHKTKTFAAKDAEVVASQASILAIFSALLLHEHLVSVHQWLGDVTQWDSVEDPNFDPTFAIQTLKVSYSLQSLPDPAPRWHL